MAVRLILFPEAAAAMPPLSQEKCRMAVLVVRDKEDRGMVVPADRGKDKQDK